MNEEKKLTKQQIQKFLKDSGIHQDDTVTIHISLKNLGPVEGGVDGLIDALKEYLEDGMLLIPTHTWANVNKDSPYYDVLNTNPCIGVLPSIAAARKDGYRSLHPTHSLTGFGKNAAVYLKDENRWSTAAPVGSALSRLYEENGKILLIGVGLERCTYLHAVDERLQIPNRHTSAGYQIQIKDHQGRLSQSPLFFNHSTEGLDTCCSDFYPNYLPAFLETGAVKKGSLGHAEVLICDARKMTDTAAEIWKHADHDFCLKPETIPSAWWNPEGQKKAGD